MIGTGEIIDAKTILLLHYAELAGLVRGGDNLCRGQATAR
jgi:hypothetical protein